MEEERKKELDEIMEELVRECVKEISPSNFVQTAFAKPEHPILFIGVGQSEQQRLIVKETIESLWPIEKKHIPFLKYNTETKELFRNDIEEKIVHTLQADQHIFDDFNHIWIVHFINIDDSAFEEYVKRIEENNWWQVVVAFLDNSTQTKREVNKEKCEKLYALKEKGIIKGIVIIGNKLQGGNILPEYKKDLNYRLAVNVMGILNSRTQYGQDFREKFLNNHDADFFTAAYILIEKPLNMIVEVVIRTLLIECEKMAINKARKIPAVSGEFRRFLDQGKILYNLEKSFEDLFEEKFIGMNEFHKYLPEDNDDKQKVWNLFRKRQFEKPIADFFDSTKPNPNRRQMMENILEQFGAVFGYCQLIHFCQNGRLEERKQDVCEFLSRFSENENISLYQEGVMSAKTKFYENVSPHCISILESEYKKAEKFNTIIQNTLIKMNMMINETRGALNSLHENVEEYYQDVVKSYVNMHDDCYKDILKSVEDIKEIKKQIRQGCFSVFQENQRVFESSFTDELDRRMEDKPEHIKEALILEALGADQAFFDRQCRLQCAGLSNGATYCMVNGQAKFREAMKNNLGNLIDANRNDCVERIKIYAVKRENLI